MGAIAPDKVGRTAVRMLRRGESQDAIMAVFDNRYDWSSIQKSIDRYKLVKHNQYLGRHRVGALGLGVAAGPTPPPTVLQVRDRRKQLQHATLTAHLLGDPLPGESALDRRTLHTASPSIVSVDPLDGLVFGRVTAI